MNTKELDIMVNAMRTGLDNIKSRMDITNIIFYLAKGLNRIDKKDLAMMLVDLYYEIDGIDTDEIVKLGTFK